MSTPIRFVVEILAGGRVRARGVDADIRLEADTLLRLERALWQLVQARIGAGRSVQLLLGARPTPR